MIPQIIVLALLCWNIVMVGVLHGKPRGGNYNFWTFSLESILELAILYWGGFFNGLF